ncbi:rRNA maturation RNase YbeY [Mangrovibacterium diazotrophicum]|uniref:Endoribonuclease YbeY n=1 Tax=Mangrovibacterium diazotrophicum TaxID=1261403 RepID=A0A419W9Z6_9BACT|nr:rRNA maturation RNase YbeY [Mangrovibacterium diazotrophicum]
MPILFYHEDVKPLKLERRKIKTWISSVIASENKKIGSINFIFCSDEYLLQVNKQYLDHDYFTDIITFDYVEGKLISGDIFVSVDRVSENADKFQVSFDEELRRILVHGVLHLLGYPDKEPEQKKVMTQKEDHYLATF